MIDFEAHDAVAWLYLNRPAALNALDRPLTAALEDALDAVAAREDVRVLIVAGRGRAFCAGNDIAEMATLSPSDAEALATRQAHLMERFGRLPQVTLAAVEGHALGGGCMLALAQDLRLASDRARFGLPEVTLGFNPAYGIARLLDVVGGGVARELLLTPRVLRAQDALRLGLVNRVVAAATLHETAALWAREIARAPRDGLAATKRIVARLRAGQAGREPEAYAAALGTVEAQALLQAFLARRGLPR
ncbi:MAG: enoyl-CoA hydratase/isomerase family protein [Candidatus Rokuibacteriota bacterium]